MTVTIHHGDCLAVLPTLAADSVDACVCDPPYHLTSIVKRFGGAHAAPAKDRDGAFVRQSRGFMGKVWDGGDIAFRPETWREVMRVLKPGAHLLAFGGTRTYHRMACAIEDAGFEIRDMLGWLYGTGFPKSHDVSKDIDRMAGAEREVIGRNPNYRDPACNAEHHAKWNNASMTGDITAPATDAARQWNGWGTALKPAQEPIVMARKPLSEKTVAANVLRWGTGAINIGGCRVGDEVLPAQRAGQAQIGIFERYDMVTPERVGRWPANIITDGGEEVLAAFPDTHPPGNKSISVQYGSVNFGANRAFDPERNYTDSGSAARFFYTAKADAGDRLGSKHPTVKPVDLMAYLVRLVTPPGGIVLDPFAGSGTTGMACLREGFDAILIEREVEYVADIRRRLDHVKGADTPLFAGAAE